MAERVVWKYELPGTENPVDLPSDAQILHVATQGDGRVPRICMWVLVDPDAPMRRRLLYVVGTGHPLPPDILAPVHVGSFLTDPQGTYVFHVFESLDAKLTSAMAARDGGQADG